MKAAIQLLLPGHLEELNGLISVFENVFEMERYERPGESHLQSLLKKDNFFAVIAKTEDKIIAGLTVYVLERYFSEKPLAYIYDLAVLPDYQRKGIGRTLIEFTYDLCRQRGYEGVLVQAEKIDGYAIDFYRSTKPAEELEVVHFYYNLNV